MRALGSSLFLKNRFGAGYRLTMVKRKKKKNRKIDSYLTKNLGPCELMSEVSAEITYLVPKAYSKKFKTFFEQFDHDIHSLGIESYGISITTLEEVFLKINKELNIPLDEVI
jgi:ATP-binding cassette, subfamily A (ABC1), member 3